MRRIALVILALGFCGLAPSSSSACRCPSPDPDLADSGLVMLGTVQTVGLENPRPEVETDDLWVGTFRVDALWRGPATSSLVTVASPAQDCGVSFKIGEQYLIYAKPQGERRLTTQCDGTRRSSDATQQGRFFHEPGRGPVSRDEAKSLAKAYWQSLGIAASEFDEFGIEPYDLGEAWRVWSVTPQHLAPPLEVFIDRQSGQLIDARPAPQKD